MSSDDEKPHNHPDTLLGLDDSDDDDDATISADEDVGRTHRAKRRRVARRDEDSEDEAAAEDSEAEAAAEGPRFAGKLSSAAFSEEDEKDEEDGAEEAAADTGASTAIITNPSALKPLTPAELAASKAATAKTGVVYLSRIPPFMKPQKVRDLLSRFGAIGRVFLAPEDPKAHAKRVKFGGNKKRNFVEGWVEFLNKRDAKTAAETLNTQIVGGKKGSYYYDDLWNIKYLKKFKWHHLQAQIGESFPPSRGVENGGADDCGGSIRECVTSGQASGGDRARDEG
jgi:ESF2/ABP1 family protein